MLTKYGTDNITLMLFISIALLAIAMFVQKPYLSYPLAIMGLALAVFTFWFFRDPDRQVTAEALQNKALVVAPADGKVLQIIDINEDKYLHCPAKQISIFLSPLNVHVNRIPMSGIVKYFKYNPGQYIIANHPKSSSLNEQTYIGVENEYGKIFFKQIVGVVARRLVWDIKEGDSVTVGNRFGMMKFGSRMDVIIPQDTKIFVHEGDCVKAAVTKIAELKH